MARRTLKNLRPYQFLMKSSYVSERSEAEGRAGSPEAERVRPQGLHGRPAADRLGHYSDNGTADDGGRGRWGVSKRRTAHPRVA